MRSLFRFCCLFVLFLLLKAGIASAQSQQPYNRFQYSKLRWQVFRTPAFHIYFSDGGDSLCSFVARELPGAVELIKARMVSSLDWKHTPAIIIYPSLSQQYQSNIGAFQTAPVTLPTLVP